MNIFIDGDCEYVKGAKNAAIYDLKNEKVYSINEFGKKVLDNFLNDNKYIGTDEEIEFISKLIQLKLLSTENSKIKKDLEKNKPALKYAWLELTDLCNLKCVHCYGTFGNNKLCKNENLDMLEWKKVIDKLIEIKCFDIQLIGGEPMAYPDFFEILEYACKSGMKRIDIFTNATLINEKNIQKLKRKEISVRVSLYGHVPEIHERVTGIQGSFLKTENALKLLKKNDISTSISVIVMEENEKYIKDIENYILSIGYKYAGYDVIRPSCKNDEVNSHKVTDVDILKKRYNTYPEFYINKKQFKENQFYNSCWNSKIAITSRGDVIPCIFSRDEIAGNVKLDTYESIRKNIVQKWMITKDNVDICKDCEYRYACHDCRPIAKGIKGDLLSKYPRCCYNPYEGVWENLEDVTDELSSKNIVSKVN